VEVPTVDVTAYPDVVPYPGGFDYPFYPYGEAEPYGVLAN